HNRDSAGPVPDRVCPRIVGNSDAFGFVLLVLQTPRRGVHAASIDGLNCGQFGANSSEICGFLAQPSSRIRNLRWTSRATRSQQGCATQLSGLALRFSLSRARAGPLLKLKWEEIRAWPAHPPGGLAAAVNAGQK